MADKNTREQIIVTAFRLFMHGSYRDVTMNQLVKEAGLSKGAFYHYFKGKQELFEATVDWMMQQSTSSLPEVDLDCTFRECFYKSRINRDQQIVDLVSRTGCKDLGVNYYKFIFNANEYYPGFQERVMSIIELDFSNWRRAVKQAQKSGEIRDDISATLVARHINVMMDGIGVQALLRSRPDLVNDWAEEMFEQFYGLLKP